jgi:integrase
MEKAHIERMLDVIRPDSPENPWKGGHVRVRNQLIFNMLLALGLRKSELLVARLEDLDLRTNQVLIARRADDPLDPRADAPNTKTLDRLLVLSDDLAQMIRSYIKERRLIAGARRYPHLLLANGTGRPLSKQALNKLFVELRTKVPGLPDELQPHVLRHSWNDEFSALMDRRNIAPAEEERMRKQQMGWSDNSKMSAVYTKRHTKRRTDKASLDLQTEMMSKGADKE